MSKTITEEREKEKIKEMEREERLHFGSSGQETNSSHHSSLNSLSNLKNTRTRKGVSISEDRDNQNNQNNNDSHKNYNTVGPDLRTELIKEMNLSNQLEVNSKNKERTRTSSSCSKLFNSSEQVSGGSIGRNVSKTSLSDLAEGSGSGSRSIGGFFEGGNSN